MTRSSLDRDVDRALYAWPERGRPIHLPWAQIVALLALLGGICYLSYRCRDLGRVIEAQENTIRSLTQEIYYGGK